MTPLQTKSGLANIRNAQVYYETAGKGIPFVMIHAGVADSRQWNNEFAFFAQNYQVVRYDMHAYGKSEPVDGEFSHLGDLIALLDTLELWDVLDKDGIKTGRTVVRGQGLEPDDFHLAVHIWIRNEQGEHLIQKRAEQTVNPGI